MKKRIETEHSSHANLEKIPVFTIFLKEFIVWNQMGFSIAVQFAFEQILRESYLPHVSVIRNVTLFQAFKCDSA